MPTTVKDTLITCFGEQRPFRVTLSDGAQTIEFAPGIMLGRGRVLGEDTGGNIVELSIDDIAKVEMIEDWS